MDDEEEDMSRPISQLWGTPFRDIKYEDRATQMAGQALAVGPTSQSHNNNSISTGRPSCALHWQPRIPFQGRVEWTVLPLLVGFNCTITQLVALLSAGMLIGNHPQRQE